MLCIIYVILNIYTVGYIFLFYKCIILSHTKCVFVSSSLLFSASTDKTVCVWDSETGERVKRLKGHTSFVNSCFPARRGPQLACTGSDDGTVKVNSAHQV